MSIAKNRKSRQAGFYESAGKPAHSKKILLAFLIFLSSCSSKCGPWQYRQSVSYHPASELISYKRPIKIFSTPNEVEVVEWDGNQQVYINLLICPLDFPCESVILFSYIICDQTYEGKAILLEGGQRLLVRQEDAERMIEAWRAENEVVFF